jgi:hypothetical protein
MDAFEEKQKLEARKLLVEQMTRVIREQWNNKQITALKVMHRHDVIGEVIAKLEEKEV